MDHGSTLRSLGWKILIPPNQKLIISKPCSLNTHNSEVRFGNYQEGSTGRSGRHYGFGVMTAWGPVRRIPITNGGDENNAEEAAEMRPDRRTRKHSS